MTKPKVPMMIAELREALPGWKFSHGRMGGFRNYYRVSIQNRSWSKWKSFDRYRKIEAIAAAYAAACAFEKAEREKL